MTSISVVKCTVSTFDGVAHASPCTCVDKDLIDLLETTILAVGAFRHQARNRGIYDLHWEDMDQMTHSACVLQRKLVEQSAARNDTERHMATRRKRVSDEALELALVKESKLAEPTASQLE